MQIRWFRFITQRRYRHGTARDRRIIELKVSLALALRTMRQQERLTQKQLAVRLGTRQHRVSELEQIAVGVSFDAYVDAFIALGASDEDIARAFNAGECFPVRKLRAQAALRLYPPPIDRRSP